LQKIRVPPANIPSWIKDLFDSNSLIDIDKKEDHDADDAIILTSSIKTKEKEKDLKELDKDINKNTYTISPNNEKTDSSIEETVISSPNPKQTGNSYFALQSKIPFVSHLFSFLKRKKK
jgi:hypothetical protein